MAPATAGAVCLGLGLRLESSNTAAESAAVFLLWARPWKLEPGGATRPVRKRRPSDFVLPPIGASRSCLTAT